MSEILKVYESKEKCNMQKCKILATVGPSLNSVKEIEGAIKNGVEGFRLHLGSIERDNIQYFKNINNAKINLKRPDIKVFLDFPGARPRTIKETKEIKYEVGDLVKFVDSSNLSFCEDKNAIKLDDFSRYIFNMQQGEVLEFRGGKVIFSVVNIDLLNECVEAINIKAEKNLKELNVCTLKHTYVDYYPFSSYDIHLIKKMKENQLIPDYIALSFCTCIEQIKLFREIINSEFEMNIKCYAKIENRKGVWSANEIVNYVDGLFIARSDLSINFPFMYWADLQNFISNIAHNSNKELCIGSEFLSYFSKKCIVNRGEIIDVNIAIQNKAHWMMLSGETGNSLFSLETIELLNNIINYK